MSRIVYAQQTELMMPQEEFGPQKYFKEHFFFSLLFSPTCPRLFSLLVKPHPWPFSSLLIPPLPLSSLSPLFSSEYLSCLLIRQCPCLISFPSVSSLCALAHRWLRGVLAVCVSSVRYLLNTSCCPWTRGHANVINLTDAHVQTHTYLRAGRKAYTCVRCCKQVSNTARRVKRDEYGSHQEWRQNRLSLKRGLFKLYWHKMFSAVSSNGWNYKPRKWTLLHMMVCWMPAWPQCWVSLPILQPFVLDRVSQTPPSPSFPGGRMQPDTHLGPISQPTILYFLVCVSCALVEGWEAEVGRSSVQQCSHSPAETDRWNHFTHRQKGRIQETGVCLIVLVLLRLVLI